MLGLLVGLAMVCVMGAMIIHFGYVGLMIFCAIIVVIAFSITRRKSREEAKKRHMEYERELQQQQALLNQEKHLLERIKREEDIPESAAQIFIISSTKDAPRHMREIPAYLWQEGEGYKLMPVGPDQLPVYLRQKVHSIIAEAKDYFDATGLIPPIPKVTHYLGPFASEFSKVAETRIYVRDRNHPDSYRDFGKTTATVLFKKRGKING